MNLKEKDVFSLTMRQESTIRDGGPGCAGKAKKQDQEPPRFSRGGPRFGLMKRRPHPPDIRPPGFASLVFGPREKPGGEQKQEHVSDGQGCTLDGNPKSKDQKRLRRPFGDSRRGQGCGGKSTPLIPGKE